MANIEDKQISDLDSVSSIDSDSLLLMQQQGIAVRVTAAQLKEYVGEVSGGGSSEIEVGVGKSLAGLSVQPDSTATIPAGDGAEIFNDYRERTFQGSTGAIVAAGNVASGAYSHAEGNCSTASGAYSHAECSGTKAAAANSHAEGNSTIASGSGSHSEGSGTTASGSGSHAEGGSTTASGGCAHAEGAGGTEAKGYASHAEGQGTHANGESSHSEGSSTTASNSNSHAEGSSTTASGNSSHAEGSQTEASGKYSHAEGRKTVAAGECQHAMGQYNIEDSASQYALIVGNGNSSARSNALTLDWQGNLTVSGSVVGGDGKAIGASAIKLETARTINGVPFDGTSNIKTDITNNTATPEMHRTIYRGKNLGTFSGDYSETGILTDAQKTAISSGTFDDVFLGDYWKINGVIWRIVDFDYWYNTGDTSFTKHHLVIMPDSILYSAKMNETNTTEGGYVGSLMYTENLNQAKTTISTAFGPNVLSHREYLVNAVSDGKPSAGAWFDSTVELPSEIMIYGHFNFKPASDGVNIPALNTIDKTQLSLFTVRPGFANNRGNYWLRDVVSPARFARVISSGLTDYLSASYANGIRPVFAIGVN